MLWLAVGFVSCATVLLHLYLILTFVFLNKLVIFRLGGEEKVKVAHFVLFSVFLVGGGVVILCCICCFSFVVRWLGSC